MVGHRGMLAGSIPATPRNTSQRRNGAKMDESIETTISKILWRAYETSLPDTPYRMAIVIAHQLRKAGHIPFNNDPSKQEGRESNATI